MQTLDYIVKKYKVDLSKESPITLPLGREEHLPGLFKELGFKVGAEVGVQKGSYTEILCKAGFKIFGIDKWLAYEGYNDFKKQKQLDDFEKEARKKVKGYDCTFIKRWSIDAVKKFEDESLDFVFIDGNHDFRHVTEDIDDWSKKVRKGGIVYGHDFMYYRGSNKMHVKYAVPAYLAAYNIKPWFVLKAPHHIPCWMYVK